MKTYKVELTEEFIKEAHEVACDEWKTKIKDLVPEAFKSKLEVGKWYKSKDPFKKSLVFLHSYDTNEIGFFINDVGYGFNYRLLWRDKIKLGGTRPNELTRATDKEVEEVLIKEAKKRGLVEGVQTISLRGAKRLISTNRYLLGKNRLYADNGSITIFHNGKWAEPIEDNTEKRKRNYILQKIEEMEEQLNELKKEL